MNSTTSLVAVLLLALAFGSAPSPVESEGQSSRRASGSSDPLDAEFEETVRTACSRCHAWPPPHVLPRHLWRPRIQEMATRSMAGTGLAPGQESLLWQQDLDRITRFYEARASKVLDAPEAWPDLDGPSALQFVRHSFRPSQGPPLPVVANVRFMDLEGDARAEIVVCDMGHGVVLYGRPYVEGSTLEILTRIPNPSHATMTDLDQDGMRDLLIADLGDFLPGDHQKGTIVWLRQVGPGAFEKLVLATGLPRVADVEAADFDGDSDLDLVVAAFGWQTVGSTLIYENQTEDWSQPKFEGWPIDARSGAIHVPTADLNGDDATDVVALISQQHEKVVAFLNRGEAQGFRMETIFEAPFPAWGSSGIQLVDLDRDDDLDVLMTNGDTLDDDTVKPYHGIRFLENRGGYPYVRHDLAGMPGVHRAQAADLDGDGDLDVVAAAFLPDPNGDYRHFASLAWLEQVAPGQFERHTLEQGQLSHTTLDLADYDQDGDVDIAVGNFVAFTFSNARTGVSTESWIDVWENID